jgi:hypothetical protein
MITMVTPSPVTITRSPVTAPGAEAALLYGASSRSDGGRKAPIVVHMLLPAVLAALVAVVHTVGLSAAPAYADDEGTYAAQAWALLHEGQLAHYTYWYDHPPLGWILLAGWDVVTGWLLHPATAVEGARQFAALVATVTGLLIYLLGRRQGLPRWAAGLAVMLWTLSPLALLWSREMYLDNVGTAFLLGALVLVSSPRRHLWAFAGSGLCAACAVLSKETLLLSLPAVGYAAWRGSAGRTRPFCLAAFTTTAVSVQAMYPLYATLKGELLHGATHVSLLDAVQFQLMGRSSTGSPLSPHAASAVLVGQWLHSDPWLLACGVLLTPLALNLGRLRAVALAVAVPVAVSLRPGYLPDPFVIALLPFCALIIAGLLTAAIGGLSRGSRRAGALVALAALAVVVMPPWSSGVRADTHGDAAARQVLAENWIAGHVPHDRRLVVDDTMWVDLVNRGFNPHLGVIWFYKTDFTNNLDPSVARTLPNGYRDIDDVLVTPIMRSAFAQFPGGFAQLRAAIRYSRILYTVGAGADRIEIRQVVEPPGAPPLPNRR